MFFSSFMSGVPKMEDCGTCAPMAAFEEVMFSICLLGYSAELESIIVAKQLDDLADGESSSALLFWRSTRSED